MKKTQNTKVCIKGDGTEEYGKVIIDYLKNISDTGTFYNGDSDYYYYLDNDGAICMSRNQPKGYTEIFLNKPQDENGWDSLLKSLELDDLIGLESKGKMYTGNEVVSILKEYENGFDSMNSLIEKYGLEEYNYHTPKVEEFHVGFKFEYKKENTSTWIKHNMTCLNYRVENTMDIDRLLHFYPQRFRALNK